MAFNNLANKTIASTNSTTTKLATYKQEKEKATGVSVAGNMPFIAKSGTRQADFFPLINVGNFCTTAQEVTDAKARVVSFKDVFSAWKRFSHMAETVPPAIPAELDNWSYTEATDTIVCTVNSASHIGIVSRDKYLNWELEAELSSVNGDDDTISIVLCFVTDSAGVERTLTLTRGPGGNPSQKWGYSYNLNNSRAGLTTQYVNTEKINTVKWGSGNYGATATEAGYTGNANGGWGGLKRCKVHVKREGDIITCRTTEFELFDPTLSYIDAATITIDLKAHPEGEYFRQACAYGYSCYSQDRSSWKVLKFVGDTRVVYDIIGKVVHTDDGSGWKIDNTRSLATDYGVGKLLYSRFTGKLFYMESETEIYRLNAAAW